MIFSKLKLVEKALNNLHYNSDDYASSDKEKNVVSSKKNANKKLLNWSFSVCNKYQHD